MGDTVSYSNMDTENNLDLYTLGDLKGAILLLFYFLVIVYIYIYKFVSTWIYITGTKSGTPTLKQYPISFLS